jgi:predicted RNA-binding Zn-ribbon protein involved in translation (DUF1610 family)
MKTNNTDDQENTPIFIKGISADSATLPTGIELEGNVSIERIEVECNGGCCTGSDESESEADETDDQTSADGDPDSEPVTHKECQACGEEFDMRSVGQSFDGTTATYRCPHCGEWQPGPFVSNQ